MARPRTTLSWHWAEPEATNVVYQLASLADELDDFIPPMTAAATVAEQNMEQRFKTGTDPTGRAWDDWSEGYRARSEHTKVFPDRASLQRSDYLKETATDQSAFIVTRQGLFFDASGLPEYWAWNNFGAARKPKGMSAGEAESEVRRLIPAFMNAHQSRGQMASPRKAAQEAYKQVMNILPARPFVGLSIIAQNKIIAIFELWFNDEVTIARSSRGRAFARRRPRRK
jgi:phage gpG-like protein